MTNNPGDESKKTVREVLAEGLDEADWSWFEPHLKRDSVILVSVGLDLLSVAEKVAQDDQEQIGEWIRAGLLAKPTAFQLDEWKKTPHKKFLTLIVRPYVLAQEHLVH
jgi:hypothetical protein